MWYRLLMLHPRSPRWVSTRRHHHSRNGRDRLPTDVADLRALANYAAGLYRRRLVDDASSLSTDDKKHVAEIRQAVLHREFIRAFDLLAWKLWCGDDHILFLRRAFPLLSDEEKAACLSYVWVHLKECSYRGRALKLFQQAAPGLKSTIPKSWPTAITVYRGRYVIDLGDEVRAEFGHNIMSHASLWRRVQRDVRKGLAWTTDRAVALDFAKVGRQLSEGSRIISCLGSATVSRQDVIAYFGAQDGDEVPCVFDHEKECIIDPQRIGRVTYEEITTLLD